MPDFCFGTADPDIKAFECRSLFDPRCWTGVPADPGSGDADDHGCDIGCYPCHDLPPGVTAGEEHVWLSGKRSLRRHPTLPTRDVFGREFDGRSGVAYRVPERVAFLRSACWSNDGGECLGPPDNEFGQAGVDWCGGCFPSAPAGAPNCGGVGLGELVPGRHVDEFFYQGHRHNRNDIECRHISEHTNLTVDLRSDGTGQAIFARFGTDQHRPCYPNRMVKCAGRVPQESDCPTGAASQPGIGVHYNDGPERSVFDPLHIDWPDLHIRQDAVFTNRDDAVIDVQNTLITYVRNNELPGVQPNQNVRFDRLDYTQERGGAVDIWQRSYNRPVSGSDPVPCETLPEVPGLVWPNCRLRHRGCQVECRGTIAAVDFLVSLVPYGHKINQLDPDDNREFIRISARAELLIFATVRAALVEKCPGIEIVNHPGGACHLLPEVIDGSGTVVDEIVFVDNQGRELTFPPLTTWFGYFGEFSFPQWDTRELDSDPFDCEALDGSAIHEQCLLVAAVMSNTRIPGRPTIPSIEDDPNKLYGGDVGFRFDWQQFCEGG